jgi:peptide-methionine (S)-S-oxide reductase
MSVLNSVRIAALTFAAIASTTATAQPATIEKLVVAGGCFWCVESDFESVNGVVEAVSGFSGGDSANPTYKQVSRGGTGHVEAVEITYDADIVSHEQLIHLFLRSIDPTDAGGQFCDRGEPYKTAIFYSNDAEKSTVLSEIKTAQTALSAPIVTRVEQAGAFYPAEARHQDYYKGGDLTLGRFGALSQAKAYKKYRNACGRDQAVNALWGEEAPFTGVH